MFFTLVGSLKEVPATANGKAFLVFDRWDDWGEFETQFYLVVFNHNGERSEPGQVKIGHFGLQPGPRSMPGARVEEKQGVRAPWMENTEFDALGESYFSLGQDENYYETLNRLPDDLRQVILQGLRDCALDLGLFEGAKNEQVMQSSLLRKISPENVRNRLHRLARGEARLSEFKFQYIFPQAQGGGPSLVLTFDVQPDSIPSTNVHVIVGRNGSGKSRCLRHMAKSLLGEKDYGEFRQLGTNKKDWTVAGLVFVSFSAFDRFDLPRMDQSKMHSAMVGLRQTDGTQEGEEPTDSLAEKESLADQLTKNFIRSFEKCRFGLRRERWQSAIKTLENDPLFAEAEITTLLSLPDGKWEEVAENLFPQLSSGHAIVLLTITRLVELVDERTLVLFDEPEGHLHPPLLSAFIRSLADLLIKRNGIAIIATHSPVVLQEVPKSCVWMLRRAGNVTNAERPMIETFGENVGTLTREVFGLEVTTTGFHKLVRDAVEVKNFDYESVLNHFDRQLGAEARAITRGLIANRDTK